MIKNQNYHTVRELSDYSGLSEYRILQTLEEEGYISRNGEASGRRKMFIPERVAKKVLDLLVNETEQIA